jgi:quercetin dioxygenase-like cupin family protein
VRGEQLVRCLYFDLDRFEVGDILHVAPGRLSIWIVLAGMAELQSASYRRRVCRGDTVLVPANGDAMGWHATTGSRRPTLLRVQLPTAK